MWHSPNPARICQIKLIPWVIQIRRQLLMSASMSCCLLSYVIGSKLKRFFGWVGLDIRENVVLQITWWRSWTKMEAILNQAPSWTGVKVVMWFWPMAAAIFFDTSIRLFMVNHWFWILRGSSFAEGNILASRKFEELGQETTAKSRQERCNRNCKLETSLGQIRIWGYKYFWWFKCKIRSGIDQLGLFTFVFTEGKLLRDTKKSVQLLRSHLVLRYIFSGFPNSSTLVAFAFHLLIKKLILYSSY